MVLNVLDEIIDGVPKYNITPNADGTSNIELANDVIVNGTALNKSLFDKIENVLSYNAINGEYNETNQNIEYTMQSLDTTSLSNNMRVLISPANKPIAPLSNWNYVKERTQINSYFQNPSMIKMSNGNIMYAGYRDNSNKSGFYYITDQKGNVVKTVSSLGNDYQSPKLIELENGNILIFGNTSAKSIYDKQGNQISTGWLPSDAIYLQSNLLKLNNGNIIIASTNKVGDDCYVTILNYEGTEVGNPIVINELHGTSHNINMLQLSNNTLIICGNTYNLYGAAKTGFAIINNDGDVLSSNSDIGTFESPKILEMKNGNILILGYASGSVSKIVIINKNGEIVKSETSIGSQFNVSNMVGLDNGNILILGNYSTDLYGKIIDQQGNVVKNSWRITSQLYSPKPFMLSNGYIVIMGYSSTSSDGIYMMIVDQQGNNVLDNKGNMGGSWNPKFIETDEGDLIMLGDSYSGSTGQFEIIGFVSSFNNVTLNNVVVDTLLGKDKYYELVYNWTLNKFIAEEVRNAN